MEESRWEELVRRWLNEAHGPVLALDFERLPEDLRKQAVVVNQDNVMCVVELVARGAACVFYDPNKYLDAAIIDKMLVVKGFASEEKKGTRGS